MYSDEQRKNAIELYLKYGRKASLVIKELGYPNRLTLRNWFYEYRDSGNNLNPRERKSGPSQYSEEQMKAAVQFYIEHGKVLTFTSMSLGYPRNTHTLAGWIKKYAPAEKRVFTSLDEAVSYPQEVKEAAVIDLCVRGHSAEAVAKKHKVQRSTIYFWKNQFLGEDYDMKKDSHSPDDVDSLKKEAEDLRLEVKKLRLERDVLLKAAEVLKKGKGVNLQSLTNREKVIVIDALRSNYLLKDLLKTLSMAKSSYCYQKTAMKQDKYDSWRSEIKEVFNENHRCYGYRRIYQHIKNTGRILSEKVVRRLMHELGIKVSKRMIRKYNSYKGEITPAVENLVMRNFHASDPNKLWLTDITEFHIPAGKVYLSPIIDCYDGMAVSWTIGTSPSSELTNQMLRTAINMLGEERPILHSDRGLHYRTNNWIEIMNTAGLVRSMSKKGCSPDNSACEGFFGRLKNEMFYNRKWLGVSIAEFVQILDDYRHWYNEKRIKISLGGKSPLEYRRSISLAS